MNPADFFIPGGMWALRWGQGSTVPLMRQEWASLVGNDFGLHRFSSSTEQSSASRLMRRHKRRRRKQKVSRIERVWALGCSGG